MSPIEMQFIDDLSLEEKRILKSLLDQDKENVQNYLVYLMQEQVMHNESQKKENSQQNN